MSRSQCCQWSLSRPNLTNFAKKKLLLKIGANFQHRLWIDSHQNFLFLRTIVLHRKRVTEEITLAFSTFYGILFLFSLFYFHFHIVCSASLIYQYFDVVLCCQLLTCLLYLLLCTHTANVCCFLDNTLILKVVLLLKCWTTCFGLTTGKMTILNCKIFFF